MIEMNGTGWIIISVICIYIFGFGTGALVTDWIRRRQQLQREKLFSASKHGAAEANEPAAPSFGSSSDTATVVEIKDPIVDTRKEADFLMQQFYSWCLMNQNERVGCFEGRQRVLKAYNALKRLAGLTKDPRDLRLLYMYKRLLESDSNRLASSIRRPRDF